MKGFWAGAFCACLFVGGVVALPAVALEGCEAPAPPPVSDTARSDAGPVVAARYSGATTAYGHGVLGDAVEASALLVRMEGGAGARCDVVEAGPERVFEDTGPRLVDLDGDGLNEVIVVASHDAQGARLEVYGYGTRDGALRLLAHTPYIGTRFRWLAPVGAADLDGDGHMEIAYIDRPHLAKTLRIWRFKDGALTEIAVQQGYSNHKIGWPFIAGGLRDCGAGPEMILATGNWSRVMAARMQGGIVVARDLGAYWSPESLAEALICGEEQSALSGGYLRTRVSPGGFGDSGR